MTVFRPGGTKRRWGFSKAKNNQNKMSDSDRIKEATIEATIYAFKLLAAAQGKPYTTCTAFSEKPSKLPGKHEDAAIYISTWIVPMLEIATGLSYREWCEEEESKQVVAMLRSLRNSMAAHPDAQKDGEFAILVSRADLVLQTIKNQKNQ